jgi:cytochrome c oxidase cbb3-type subunit 2
LGDRRALVTVVVAILIVGGAAGIWYALSRNTTHVEPAAADEESQVAKGQRLYGNYCAPCHGEKGDGNGPAARFLYPRPRNFGEQKFRLATTDNAIPTDDDLLRVITRGMPGSAMFPFGHLSEHERLALVAQVRRLIRAATEAQIVRDTTERGNPVDPDDLPELVRDAIQVGKPIEVPAHLPPSDDASIGRGKELYTTKGCVSCHGEKGTGEGVKDQRDDNGMPTKPRDFTRGIFKSGRDPRLLYARVTFGMRGTPMPGSNLQPEQIGDLVNYVLSLSDEKAQARVEHKRSQLVAKRVKEALDGDIADETWQSAESIPVVVTPLWWRNYAEPELRVAALHNGKTLAIRLTWRDETRDDRPVRPQDFDDMASVQLFKGSPEPFLGMGQADKPLDVWLWRARWQSSADVDSVYPNLAVDLYPLEKPKGPPHATKDQPLDFLTAQAAGNLNADSPGSIKGSNLQAKGFGTLTARPRLSQIVGTNGTWKDKHWTVVFRRPLAAKGDDGIPLAAGDKLSLAFALWDGSAGDRNGQKLVSIWHDLKLGE